MWSEFCHFNTENYAILWSLIQYQWATHSMLNISEMCVRRFYLKLWRRHPEVIFSVFFPSVFARFFCFGIFLNVFSLKRWQRDSFCLIIKLLTIYLILIKCVTFNVIDICVYSQARYVNLYLEFYEICACAYK